MVNAATSCESSSPNVSPRPKPDDICRLRKNLMYKLGVSVDNQMLRKRDPPSSVSILGNVKHIKEPLKSRNDDEDHHRGDDIERREQWPIWGGLHAIFNGNNNSKCAKNGQREPPPFMVQLGSSASTVDSSIISLNSSSGSIMDGNMKRQRRLSFNEEVSVCPIPKRNEYSNRIRQHLWYSAADMVKNAERNALEFASEGYDWQNVIECDEMYRDIKTNELIHPVHVEYHFQQQQQQQQQQQNHN